MKQRKKNRLENYDYSENAFYFITTCTKNNEHYFGKIENYKMFLNKYGEIVQNCWLEIPEHFEHIFIDEFIVMPNHIHGIIIVDENPAVVGNRHACSLFNQRQYQKIPVIIGSFKSSVTHKINQMQNEFLFQWQKSYYDHIVRNEKSLYDIRRYIIENPILWGKENLA
jgi:REP element-mobilizing transposase RayT